MYLHICFYRLYVFTSLYCPYSAVHRTVPCTVTYTVEYCPYSTVQYTSVHTEHRTVPCTVQYTVLSVQLQYTIQFCPYSRVCCAVLIEVYFLYVSTVCIHLKVLEKVEEIAGNWATGAADYRQNCSCGVAEVRLQSNILVKSCGVVVVDVLPSSCEGAVADNEKSCTCPPLTLIHNRLYFLNFSFCLLKVWPTVLLMNTDDCHM
jgi:hypothetical protein